MTSFVSSNLHVYWFSVINNIIFGRYYTCDILFPDLSKKIKIFEKELKNGTLFVRKASIMLMASSKQEKRLFC